MLPVIKKILNIVMKTIVGLFVFYLFVGFIVIPLALTWGIKSQGTKILKHPVSVKFVQFNPFLWRLGISGLEVKGPGEQVMVGFKKLKVDVSFLGLLKKTYRVESFEVDGLQVNPVLLADGHMNLLDLIPAEAIPPGQAQKMPAQSPSLAGPSVPQVPAASAKSGAVQPLPLVIVDSIVLKNGNVHFVDQSVQPNFSTTVGDIDVTVTGVSTRPDSQAKVVVQARLDQKGVITNETLIKPFVQPLELETTFSLNNYAMDILTPYVGKYTGRALKDGKLDFRMDYRIAGNKLMAKHKVLVQRFEFGQKVESKDALGLPFGLAVALLEDPEGRINISLPVSGDMSKPDFHYWGLVGQVVRNFFMGLVTKPFAFLASAMGAESGTDELGYVRFLPGKSDLADAEKEKLNILIKGLKERPKLRLEINGTYDSDVDWRAMKTDVLAKDFKDLREKSTRSDSWIYQELYQRRFGIRALWALTKQHRSRDGVYDDAKIIEESKRLLIESGVPDRAALDALAQARAKMVYDLLIADGLDSGRLSTGVNRGTQASMGAVPLEFTLTVFDDSAKTSEKPAAVQAEK